MNDQWYWDMGKKKAVQGDDRGPDSQVLGPYPTKEDAENWQRQVEANNEAWDDSDEEWNEWSDDSKAADSKVTEADPNVAAADPYKFERD